MKSVHFQRKRTMRNLRAVWRAMRGTGTRKLWLGGCALAMLTVLMGMALLGLSGWFITATAIAGLVPAAALTFDVFAPSAGIRLLAMGRTGSRYAERLVTHDATFAALAALRERLFRAWARPQAAQWLLMRPARLLQRLTADVDALDNLYLRLLVPVGAALGGAALLALALGFMSWWLGLLAGLWLVVSGLGIAFWHALRSRRAAMQRAMNTERLRAETVDLVAGKTELLMAGRLAAQCDAILSSDARAARADQTLYRMEAHSTMAYGVAAAVTLSACLLATAWLVEEQSIDAAVAAFGVLLALSAMEPFAALRRGAAEAGRTLLAARRLGAVLTDDEASISRHENAKDAAQAHITLGDACVRREGRTVLGPVSLEIAAGERVAFIGVSGAGKSTLLSLIAGEIRAEAGQVHGPCCSWMTQRIELFTDSIRDNLLLASPGAVDENLWDALDVVGLGTDIRALPGGLETKLGEGGLGLSGGQARRLALARLLLSEPRCWLLDEATEGLDAPVARDVLARLAAAAGSRTLLFATHWQREARLADRVILLNNGQIAGDALKGSQAYECLISGLRTDISR